MQARMLRHPLTGWLLGAQLLLGSMSAALAETLVSVWGEVADPRDGVYLSTPVAMAQGADGHVYVADMGNSRIVRFAVDATREQPAIEVVGVYGKNGHAPGKLDLPFGVAADRQGNILVADTANSRIQKFSPRMKLLARWGSEGSGPGQFRLPREIAVDSQNRYFVTDEFNSRIQVFDANGRHLYQIGGYGTGPGQFRFPQGIAIDADDNLFVADTFNHRVQKLRTSGEFVAQIGMTGLAGDGADLLQFPRGVGVDPQGNVYVVDTYNHKVKKYSRALDYMYSAGLEVGPNYAPAYPNQVLPVAADVFYVSDTGNSQLIRYQELPSGQGAEVTARLGQPRTADGQFSEPASAAVGPDGRVYVSDRYNHRIQVFDRKGRLLARWGKNGGAGGIDGWGQLPGEFFQPMQIDHDAQGRVYVADALNSRVQVLSPDGTPLAVIGGPGFLPGQFLAPTGVAVDAAGNVFVLDWYLDRVTKFDASFELVTYWGGTGLGDGEFRRPSEIAVDAAGNVYVVDTRNSRVQKFDNNGGFITKWGANGGIPQEDTIAGGSSKPGELFLPSGIRVAGNIVYVADGSNNRMQKFDLDGNFLGMWGHFSGGRGGMFSPAGLDVDAQGFIYVTDALLNRIYKYVPSGRRH